MADGSPSRNVIDVEVQTQNVFAHHRETNKEELKVLHKEAHERTVTHKKG